MQMNGTEPNTPFVVPSGATPVVLVYQAPGDEGTAYTLQLPDGSERVITENGTRYGELSWLIDDTFDDREDQEAP